MLTTISESGIHNSELGFYNSDFVIRNSEFIIRNSELGIRNYEVLWREIMFFFILRLYFWQFRDMQLDKGALQGETFCNILHLYYIYPSSPLWNLIILEIVQSKIQTQTLIFTVTLADNSRICNYSCLPYHLSIPYI